MSNDSKKYDAGDILDIVDTYSRQHELMYYMLDQMRSELNAITRIVDNELVTNSGLKCLEVIEQLSFANIDHAHREIVKYKTEWNKED